MKKAIAIAIICLAGIFGVVLAFGAVGLIVLAFASILQIFPPGAWIVIGLCIFLGSLALVPWAAKQLGWQIKNDVRNTKA